MGIGKRLMHAYNVFLDRAPEKPTSLYSGDVDTELGPGVSRRQTFSRYGFTGEGSIAASIRLRMAIDAASIDLRHVRLDDQGRYVQDVHSGMNERLNVEANLDQAGRVFLQDLYLTLLEQGDLAIVPIDTSSGPGGGGLFDIYSWRIGRVVDWYPKKVRIDTYNERTGRHELLLMDKRHVGLIENPFYVVMNEPNSTLQRLIRKLSLLDIVDEQASSGKLDMLIQLPYPVRNEARRQDAEQRRQDIEFQLKDSRFGIAYIDATEKVTQLNRPIENNLLKQIEVLLEQVYTQHGLTKGVMDGTASEQEMLNYLNRSTEPLLGAVADELKRKFLTKTARTQGHSVMYFRDPFKLVPMKDLAELADKFTRNEIVTSNEFRGFVGMRPSTDPKADMLINSNLTVPQTQLGGELAAEEVDDGIDSNLDSEEAVVDSLNRTLDEVFASLGVDE